MRRIRTFAKASPRLLVLAGLVVLAAGISLLWGPGASPAELFAPDRVSSLILWELRLPRILTAILVGAVLAASGAAIQGLFRNPLAGPDVLGVSVGASAGGLGFLLLFGYSALTVTSGAFVGSALAALAVFALSRGGEEDSLSRILLAGMALSSLLGGLIALMLTAAKETQVSQYVFWIMGSLENRRWSHLATLAPLALVSLAALTRVSGHLNLLALGEETARSLGLKVGRQKLLILFFSVLGTASAVAVGGAIGFIGLLVPHALRLVWGSDYRYLVPFSALTGALFLVVADTLARVVVAPFELPVGVLTALAGAPLFLFLLFRRRSSGANHG